MLYGVVDELEPVVGGLPWWCASLYLLLLVNGWGRGGVDRHWVSLVHLRAHSLHWGVSCCGMRTDFLRGGGGLVGGGDFFLVPLGEGGGKKESCREAQGAPYKYETLGGEIPT